MNEVSSRQPGGYATLFRHGGQGAPRGGQKPPGQQCVVSAGQGTGPPGPPGQHMVPAFGTQSPFTQSSQALHPRQVPLSQIWHEPQQAEPQGFALGTVAQMPLLSHVSQALQFRHVTVFGSQIWQVPQQADPHGLAFGGVTHVPFSQT